MNEDNKADQQQDISFLLNDDDDMDIDVKSSTDSDDTPLLNKEIEEILNKKEPQDVSSIFIPNVESFDGNENKM